MTAQVGQWRLEHNTSVAVFGADIVDIFLRCKTNTNVKGLSTHEQALSTQHPTLSQFIVNSQAI